MIFEWDNDKERINIEKHGIDFTLAKQAFFDDRRITAEDAGHSTEHEARYFCFGSINGRIATVRFTLRNDRIRILGAGYWRKGKALYEAQNGQLHG